MPVMSSPPKLTVPALSGIYPLTTENKVLLPAPLVPISPTSSPSRTSSDTSSSALNPAKPALSRLIDSKAMPYLLRVERLPNRPCGR